MYLSQLSQRLVILGQQVHEALLKVS